MFAPSAGLVRIVPPKSTLAKLLMIFAYFVASVQFFTMINSGKSVDVVDVWPEVKADLTKVRWEHAVNSEAFLKRALRDDFVMMLEADVTLGTLEPSKPKEKPLPIMAHPPANTSDLSLEKFIVKVAEHVIRHKAKKGIKLDFKDDRAIESSFKTLDNLKERVFNIPVWLNGDILLGPGKSAQSTPKPIDYGLFLRLASQYFPTKTLSLGWTTSPDGGDYTASHINDMISVLKILEVDTRVTFPVRAILLREEATAMEFRRLLTMNSGYTVTIWSAIMDDVDGVELARFIDRIGTDRVYLDVPEKLKQTVERALH